MSGTTPPPRTEVLESRDCWELLRENSMGRLGVWTVDHPEIFPLTYVTDGQTILFRTGPGTKLDAALGTAPVAFEIDGVNTGTNTAWSVVVQGRADTISAPLASSGSRAHRLISWQPGTKDHFVCITPELVTGRRFTVVPAHDWEISLDDATRSGLD
ncbi:pyridoxamine 5'-phosphate oxidase [Nesterenkonia sp. AN1]|uniref:pyridoxamine 5'-phosphate oxidase family protein n=1 Tax=Nesterenkonia TaxID=57494 RepID=UPI00044667B2|nr:MULTISPECIES: pyridoxamine 5'-phosphate oxidase family protein [Nesterenkonia]EXF24917.1 pyridoxamine 5'-phosphate oxidase [Nesterenkonia sp. AN1]